MAGAKAAQSASTVELSFWDKTPVVEIVLGVRAILPLVIFLAAVLFLVLKTKLPNRLVTAYGIFLCVVGMCIFNLGLTYGLGAMGTQQGNRYPLHSHH